MPRCKKDYKNLNIKLQKDISDQLEEYCERLGQTKTTAIERILQKHLEEYRTKEMEEKKQNNKGNQK